MKSGPFSFPFDGAKLPAIAYPARAAGPLLLLAHGAGAGQKHAYMVGTAERLRDRGVSVITFDFPYTASGRKLPDRNDVLEGALRAALDAAHARADGAALFAGGKSMGGRIASQVAAGADAGDIAGLVFLGYPLHPPGKPDQRRDAHLPKVRAPMLFVQGKRDPFGTPDEIAPLMKELAKGSALVAIEAGDHSHAVPKRGGAPQDAVYARIADAIAAFVRAKAEI